MTNPIVPILLVEDNGDDVILFRRALKKSGVPASLQVAEHGQLALDYLRGAGKYTDRGLFPFPSLVFLDLKMPYLNGLDVLGRLREQNLDVDPTVFILTSSAETRDVLEARNLGARAYFLKPLSPENFKTIIETGTSPAEADLFAKLQP